MNATSSPSTAGLTNTQRTHAVLAGYLGWTMDAFDFFVVVFMLGTLAESFQVSKASMVFTMTMTLLFALTMVYVWQHFSAIEVGYKVEAQKQQVEQLREQNRQLRLSEAQLSDPGRIDQIAKQLGLNTPLPGQVVRPDGSGGVAPVVAQAQKPSFSERN